MSHLPLKIDEYSFHGTAIAVAKHNGLSRTAQEIYEGMVSSVYRTMVRLEKDGRTGGYESTGGWIVYVGNYGHGHWHAHATVMWSIVPGAVTDWQEMGKSFDCMPATL